MPDYNAIADTMIDSDSFAIQDVFFYLRDNPLAMFSGETGAPRLQTAAIADDAVTYAKMATDAVQEDIIAASSVHQSEVAVQTEEDSTTASASSQLILTSAGRFWLGLRIKESTNSGWTSVMGIENRTNSATSYGSYLNLHQVGGGTVYGETTYIDSSPPYDLGDGEIPLFVWVNILAAGGMTISTAITPPWAYNGPTIIRPDQVKKVNGVLKKYKDVKVVDEVTGEIIVERKEIDQAMKNADKDLFPHPFASAQPGDQIILLDPPETEYLAELMSAGESINELLHNDYLRISNDTITREVPPGVTPAKFTWKNTARRAGEMIRDKRLQRGSYSRAT